MARITLLEAKVETGREQRITEVDIERAKRILAEGDAAVKTAANSVLTAQYATVQRQWDEPMTEPDGDTPPVDGVDDDLFDDLETTAIHQRSAPDRGIRLWLVIAG